MEHLDPKQIQEAMRIAKSPAGQQLLRHLQQNCGEDLTQAIAHSSAGEYTKATQLIAQMAKNAEFQKYLKQIGRTDNG